MKRLNPILLLFFFFSVTFSLSAQIKPVEDFVEKYPDLKKYFIYQSALRMLNQGNDPDFDRLIKHLKKINVYYYQEKNGVSKQAFQTMLNELEREEFELMVMYKDSASQVKLLGRDRSSTSQYVLAYFGEAEFALIEMDGKLDLRYLQSLKALDFSKLDELVLNTNKT